MEIILNCIHLVLEICPEMHVNEIHLPHNRQSVLINEIPPKHTKVYQNMKYMKCLKAQ